MTAIEVAESALARDDEAERNMTGLMDRLREEVPGVSEDAAGKDAVIMTREQKLALLIGFTLVLLVGVLVSDHLSSAGRATIGKVVDREQAVEQMASSAFVALPPTSPEPRQEAHASPETPPVQITMGGQPDDPIRRLVADRMKRMQAAATHLADQISAARPAVQIDRVDTKPAQSRRRGKMKRHTVREGETLWSIAGQTYGDGSLADKLASFNKGRTGADQTIYVGAELLLPSKAALLGRAPAPVAVSRRSAPHAKRSSSPRLYTVQAGDTLGEIAQRLLGSSRRWSEIVALNPDAIKDPDRVEVGSVLRLPARQN